MNAMAAIQTNGRATSRGSSIGTARLARLTGRGAGLIASGRGGLVARMEEQRLADRRLDRLRLERLGDQERGLRPLAGQQALGEGGDEDHRAVEVLQDIL